MDYPDDETTMAGVHDDERDDADDALAAATLVAGGLLGAALGAALGLLASRVTAPRAPHAPPQRVVRRVTREAAYRTRDELEELGARIERELRAFKRLVRQGHRRGWLR